MRETSYNMKVDTEVWQIFLSMMTRQWRSHSQKSAIKATHLLYMCKHYAISLAVLKCKTYKQLDWQSHLVQYISTDQEKCKL